MRFTLETPNEEGCRQMSSALPGKDRGLWMTNGPYIVGLGLFAFIALLGAGFAADQPFAQHMWVLFFILVGATFVLIRRAQFAPAQAPDPDAYMDGPIRYGSIATIFWGVIGLTVGVVVALQLAFPDLNIEPWFNFGRMRPLHTSAVIFAFGGNALIATSFYVVQRTSRARPSAAISPGSCSGAISSSSSWPPAAICSASPRAANMPSRNGMWTSG
jgi:hypothetical protein